MTDLCMQLTKNKKANNDIYFPLNAEDKENKQKENKSKSKNIFMTTAKNKLGLLCMMVIAIDELFMPKKENFDQNKKDKIKIGSKTKKSE